MSKNNLAKNQHYVPRFILKKFANKNQLLWVYDKQTDKTFPTNIRNIASETGFYNIDMSGERFSLETKLTKIESATGKIIKRIVADKALFGLSEEQNKLLAFFSTLQYCRTRHFRNNQQHMKTQFVKVMTQDLGFTVSDYPELKELHELNANTEHIKEIPKLCVEFYPYFYTKTWILMQAPKNSPFYISDNPISFQNIFSKPGRRNLGIASPQVEIYFPISPRLSLAIWCSSHENKLREEYAKYNSMKKILPNQSDTNVKNYTFLSDLLQSIEKRTACMIEPETVENLNSLQVKYSGRYIFSSKNEFSLVKDMIKDSEKYRTGPFAEIHHS